MQEPVQTPESVSRPIRLVALFEGFKGILVLVAGSGLLLMVYVVMPRYTKLVRRWLYA